jgi:hypothetical protein
MKRIFLFSSIALLISLAGCKSGAYKDPKTVLSNFFDAMAKKDFTEAKKYTTDDSEPMMNMAQMAMQNMNDDSSRILQYRKENIEIEDAVTNGDNATVPVKDRKSGEVIDFTLKKENSQWKVSVNLPTILQMARKKMKEHGMDGMIDSLGNINSMSVPNIDSISKEKMEHAHKMIDSMNKMLNDAK